MENRYVVVRNPHSISGYYVWDEVDDKKAIPESVTELIANIFCMMLNNISIVYDLCLPNIGAHNSTGYESDDFMVIVGIVNAMLSDLEALNK